MKIVVNPTYEHLRKFIESVPDTFEREGRIIYSGRNLIKVMEVDGIEINVKRYGIPALANRIVYSFFVLQRGNVLLNILKCCFRKVLKHRLQLLILKNGNAG